MSTSDLQTVLLKFLEGRGAHNCLVLSAKSPVLKQDLSPDRIARLILHILFLENSKSVALDFDMTCVCVGRVGVGGGGGWGGGAGAVSVFIPNRN